MNTQKMRKFITCVSVAASVFLIASCSKVVGPSNVNMKRDTTFSVAGQVLNDCAGKTLTVTKGKMHLTETTRKFTDSIAYTITLKGEDLQLIDGNNKKYESNESLTFRFTDGPNSNIALSWSAKFNLESSDHQIVKISFLVHTSSLSSQAIVVDKGVFDSNNFGCFIGL